jgi:uncharacterized protein
MRHSAGFAGTAVTVLGVLAGIYGCSATTTRFYTLSKVAPAGLPAGAEPVAPSVVIAIGPVSLPDYVDRAQIVVRDSPYAIRPAPFDQWAGPLADMLPRVLVGNLAERLPADRLVPFPQVSLPTFDYRLAVSITQFDVSSTGEAVVAASWQVRQRADGSVLVARDSTAHATARSPGFEDRVAALSQALGDLSNEMAGALGQLPPAPAAGQRR